jgi:hypothetical protein
MKLVNEANIALCEAYAAPSIAEEWGANLLADGMLLPGEELDFALAAGTWDWMAADCHGKMVDEQYETPVSESMTWTVSGSYAIPASLTVSNDTNFEFCKFYLMPADAPGGWTDGLTGESIQRGAAHTFALEEGLWDVAAETCHGTVLAMEKGLYVIGDHQWPVAGVFSQSETATVVNGTDTAICEVWITAATAEGLSHEILGGASTAPGASHTFNVAEGFWDLRTFDCDEGFVDVTFAAYTYGDYTWTADNVLPNHVTVLISNAVSHEVCAIHIRPSDETAWGDDYLEGATIPPGGEHELVIDLGAHDFQALGCDGTVLEEHLAIEFSEEGILDWTIDGE